MDWKIILQNRHPFSYTRISIPQPKIRIKVPNPKLLLKTMQRCFRYGCNMNNADGDNEQQQQCCTKPKMGKTRKKPGKLLATKIHSVFVNAFSSMRIKSPDGGNFTKSETKSDRVVGEHGSSGNLNGAPSELMVTDGWKSRTGRCLGNMLRREFDEEDNSKQEEREGEELCKKRILMGCKCKPLSLSETLEYDQDGFW